MVQSIPLKSSGYLAALLLVVHIAAILVLLPLALPLWSRAALIILLLANLFCLMRRDALLASPASCVGIALNKDGVELLARSGDRIPCKVLRGSLVTPAITVVKLLPQDARFARDVLILPDALDAESFRQLRVWLKWGA